MYSNEVAYILFAIGKTDCNEMNIYLTNNDIFNNK
jgi:hypothetical protein